MREVGLDQLPHPAAHKDLSAQRPQRTKTPAKTARRAVFAGWGHSRGGGADRSSSFSQRSIICRRPPPPCQYGRATGRGNSRGKGQRERGPGGGCCHESELPDPIPLHPSALFPIQPSVSPGSSRSRTHASHPAGAVGAAGAPSRPAWRCSGGTCALCGAPRRPRAPPRKPSTRGVRAP